MLTCKELINTLISELNIDIPLEFYLKDIVDKGINEGKMGNIVWLDVMSNQKERESYQLLPDEKKVQYQTKSAKIFFPDVSVDYFIYVLKLDQSEMYEGTKAIAESAQMQVTCPVNIKCMLFIFLHEVGHWEQLSKRFNWRVKAYMDWNSKEEEQIFDEQQRIFNNRKSLYGLIDNEKAMLEKLQNEYRKIPKEADADDFAKKKMVEIADQGVIKTLVDDYLKLLKLEEQQTIGLHGEIRSKKIGRNDPCPCGSGKKYKFCHGKIGGQA